MPRKSKGPRLYWYAAKQTWLIRDGAKVKRTGCSKGEIEAAERKLSEYIASKWEPDTSQHRPSDTYLANVIMIYLEHHLPTATRPRELASWGERVLDHWGNMRVNEINGAACRAFTRRSTTPSMARRDLEILRASVNFYHREYGLDFTPAWTLPEKGRPRTGHLTREMAARLLRAAYRAGNRHLVRFILIGLYTGTRSGAIASMQWLPNTTGGWFDLEHGVMYRAPAGEKATRKRKTPAVIPDRLMAHLRRWRAHDGGIRYVVHWKGRPVKRVKRAFGAARQAAELPAWVIPHVLRHTAITWAMQRGVDINTVASFFAVTVEELQRTYWHHHPAYQDRMRTVSRTEYTG